MAPSEIAWLEGEDAPRIRGSAAYPGRVQLLNPFELYDTQRHERRLTWHEMARLVGAEVEDDRAGVRPYDDRRLTTLGRERLPGWWINPPTEGVVDPAIRRGLSRVFTPAPDEPTRGVLGLYLGFGTPPDVPILSSQATAEIHENVSYAFVGVDLGAFFAAWQREEPAPYTGWRHLVSFLWPQDRSWLVHSNPDCPWTTVSGSTGVMRALSAQPDVECWPVAAA